MSLATLLPLWVAGRSVARGLPAPVFDQGGWRVDTGSEAEIARWIFAAPDDGLRHLAETITTPRYWLKWCAAGDAVALPSRWQTDPLCYVMQAAATPPPAPALASGYTLAIERQDGCVAIRIHAPDGTLAASGYGGETDQAFVYDRIVTALDHRRRGLGQAVMHALHAARRWTDTPQLLVATEQGRALYTRLGWQVLAPYSSATIPAA